MHFKAAMTPRASQREKIKRDRFNARRGSLVKKFFVSEEKTRGGLRTKSPNTPYVRGGSLLSTGKRERGKFGKRLGQRGGG